MNILGGYRAQKEQDARNERDARHEQDARHELDARHERDAQNELVVRFWGVRGSYPTPGGDIIRYGGNTACVEVSVNGSTIILDAGTGIIGLGRSLVQRARERGEKVSALLLLSHVHHDHTQGFPFFTPAYIPGTTLEIYGPELLDTTPASVLDGLMQPPHFPVRLSELSGSIHTGVIHPTDVLHVNEPVGGRVAISVVPFPGETPDPNVARIRVLRSYAHPGGVVHYRIDWQGRSVVYATDTEGYVSGDRRLANFARGADLLIHDAQYTDEHYLGLAPGMSVTQGFGHSTISMACQAAISAGARQLALFHHAPEYNDDRLDEIATSARACFSGAFVAREGQEIRFPAAGSSAMKFFEMVERNR